MDQVDFIARLEFLEANEKNGRKNPVRSGYSTHIEFENYPEYITSGKQKYIGKEIVQLGTKVDAEITILATEYFSKRLYENMNFKFCEGPRTIGFGKIMTIINPELKIESGVDHHKINLNLYSNDILTRLESDFKEDSSEAKRKIQELIKSNKEFRNNRIIRALIFTANKNINHLIKMIRLTQTDWRDLLLNAEYNQHAKKIRDFNYEFGNEELKP